MQNQFTQPFTIKTRINPKGYHDATGWDEAELIGTDTHGYPARVQLTRFMQDPKTVRVSYCGNSPAENKNFVLSGIPNGKIESCAAKAWTLVFASA